MSRNPVIAAQIDGSRLELGLHNAEAFLDLPTSVVNSDEGRSLILKVWTYTVESIVSLLFFNHGGVNTKYGVFSDFAITGTVGFGDEPFVVIGIGFLQFDGLALDHLLCPFHLGIPYDAQIFTIFDGKGDDEFLFEVILLDPAFLVEHSILGLYLIQIGNVVGSAVGVRRPSFRVESPGFEMSFQFLDGLGCNERTICMTVEPPIILRCQTGIRADDEFG